MSPDGTAYNLMSPVSMFSYRNASLRNCWSRGKFYRLDRDRLLTSNVFKTSQALECKFPAFPHFSRNLQTGNCGITSSEMRVGRIRGDNGAEHPSGILLPVIPR